MRKNLTDPSKLCSLRICKITYFGWNLERDLHNFRTFQTWFELFTRENTDEPQILLTGASADPDVIMGSNYAAHRRTVFIVHGYTSDGDVEWLMNMKDALLKVVSKYRCYFSEQCLIAYYTIYLSITPICLPWPYTILHFFCCCLGIPSEFRLTQLAQPEVSCLHRRIGTLWKKTNTTD